MKKILLSSALALFWGAAFSQGALPAFPSGAKVPTPADIRGHVIGKKFSGTRASDGMTANFEYREDGNFFVLYGAFTESGKWAAEDGKICVQDPRNGPACNEVKLHDGVMYYRRNRNGEVFPLKPM